MTRTELLAVAACLVCFTSTSAIASEGDSERLFQEARDAMGNGDFAHACPKLEQAFSLDQESSKILLALALCHDEEGSKSATALREFKDSLARAVRDKRPDRAIIAADHVQSLEKRVARVRVVQPKTSQIVEVSVDGVPQTHAELADGTPVDLGAHDVVVVLSGTPTYRTRVLVDADAKVFDVQVPSRASPPPPTTARTAAWISGGLTVAGLGTCAVFGALTFDAVARSKSRCNGTVCSPEGYALNQDARRDSVVSDVGLIVGGVAAVFAIVFAVVAARPSKNAVGLFFTGQTLGASF